jgi:hypothetical protein
MGTLKGGYIIPDEPLPEADYCLQVFIPANTDYLIQFFTALAFFGKWNSWKRVDGTIEKEVADRWKEAIERTHEAWAEGGCQMYQLRQSSSNPCQLEQSTDGGETWSLAFDYALCSNVITVPAPYPDSETGASDAAAAAIINTFEALLNLVDCEASRESYIAAATAYLRTFDAAYANPLALGAIYDAFCALDEEAQTYAKSHCPYIEHKSELEACAGADGLFDWLNCASETINNWLNDTSDDLMNALNSAAAALSGNGWQLAAGGGEGGGAGFDSGCDLTFTWEFAGADPAYTIIHGSEGDDCDSESALGDGTWIDSGYYFKGHEASFEIPVTGTLNTLRRKWRFSGAPGAFYGISLKHMRGATELHNLDGTGTWAECPAQVDVTSGPLSWAVEEGDTLVLKSWNSDTSSGGVAGTHHWLDFFQFTVEVA